MKDYQLDLRKASTQRLAVKAESTHVCHTYLGGRFPGEESQGPAGQYPGQGAREYVHHDVEITSPSQRLLQGEDLDERATRRRWGVTRPKLRLGTATARLEGDRVDGCRKPLDGAPMKEAD